MEYVDKIEQVDRLLRKRILEGEISPGSRLVERKLAEELEVSKTPIN
jgi:DNA-binding GntR family transcriptional regulator